jgi:predicted PurR-regulated permease PerM
LIGLPSPLPLAIWSGLTELIPYVGPVLGILPALIVAIISENYLGALLVLIFSFLVIQQLESAFLVPRIMGKAVGLSPVLVILSLIIGVKLFGGGHYCGAGRGDYFGNCSRVATAAQGVV